MTFSSTYNIDAMVKTDAVWQAMSHQEAVELLQSDRDRGLKSEEVARRQQLFGTNELKETGQRGNLKILWEQFTNVMLLMLIAVALISGILDLQQQNFPKDAIAILAIVILNAILGYFQESRAEKAQSRG